MLSGKARASFGWVTEIWLCGAGKIESFISRGVSIEMQKLWEIVR